MGREEKKEGDENDAVDDGRGEGVDRGGKKRRRDWEKGRAKE